MIPQTEAFRQAGTKLPVVQQSCTRQQNWQQALADIVRDPLELFELLQLDRSQIPAALKACLEFPLRIPRDFIDRMQPGDWNDPLLLQVLPAARELDYQPGFCSDPLQERDSNPVPGLIHKYHGRVLLIVSGGCAVHCRYCFRRHFPYQDNNPSREDWRQAVDYIRADRSIKEVIFSGGDPLVASDRQLAYLVAQLADIEHLTTLRIHSRLPVVIPQRIDDGCLSWMTATRLRPVMVIHSNHANEIDQQVVGALSQLQRAGVITLNQTVLLAGINDAAEPLAALSERLFAAGCLPYYLHLLDQVSGAAHFDVPESTAQRIVREMLDRLPGYLVPRLVRELPGAPAKQPIFPGV